MADMIGQLLDFEKAFDSIGCVKFMQSHAEVPVLTVGFYLAFIFTVPEMLDAPLKLKNTFAFWNLFLSIFSICGASRVVPHLLTGLMEKGYTYTVCAPPTEWYSTGPVSLWVMIFIFSKLPELGDTAFLVLRKKSVIFLHWFHHATVLLYCWHAGAVQAAPGIWFAAMNYTVHSIMYFYFFMANFGYVKLMQPFAPFITMIQILQMVGGMTCIGTVAYMQVTGNYTKCTVDPANWKLGFTMYASYFVLFGLLFVQKYRPRAKTVERAPSSLKPKRELSDSFKPIRELSDSVQRALNKYINENTEEETADDIQAEIDACEEKAAALQSRLEALSKKSQ